MVLKNISNNYDILQNYNLILVQLFTTTDFKNKNKLSNIVKLKLREVPIFLLKSNLEFLHSEARLEPRRRAPGASVPHFWKPLVSEAPTAPQETLSDRIKEHLVDLWREMHAINSLARTSPEVDPFPFPHEKDTRQ